MLLFWVLNVRITAVQASVTWSATLEAEREPGGDEYGYEHGEFGDIDDRTFRHNGRTYTIKYIKWDDSDDEIEFRFEECLKPSDFESLQIGTRTFSRTDSQWNDKPWRTDDYCASNPSITQEFEFHNISSNPLRDGTDYDIVITLTSSSSGGGGAVPTPIPRTTSASLSPDPSTVNFQPNGRWHRFTVNSSGSVKVVANPGSAPLNVEINTSDSRSYCDNGAERNDAKTRSNGQAVYLAGCQSGIGTVELRHASTNALLRTYTFSISSASVPTPTPTPTATATPAPCVNPLGTLAGKITRSSAWDSSCLSERNSGKYARFYTFSLDNRSDVQIDLTSSTDPYLYLMQGHGKNGTVVASNDDSNGKNSRISESLAPGDYTIEATTYSSGASGDFNLRISISTIAPIPTPVPTPTANCNAVYLGDLSSTGASGYQISANGSWDSGCTMGSVRSKRYVRYYRFNLIKSAHVTMDVTNGGNATIRSGTRTSGRAHYTSSDIIEATGDYTVAVSRRNAGSFALTIKGRIPWLGHQQDHTVKYKIGAIQPLRPAPQPSNPVEDPATVIPAAISSAARAWNSATANTNPRVFFCKDDSVRNKVNECLVGGTDKNTDNEDVRVDVLPGGKVGLVHRQPSWVQSVLGSNHCGDSSACVKPRGLLSQLSFLANTTKFKWLPVVGDHLQDMIMVIEEPAWSYNSSTGRFTGVFWTDDASKHNWALNDMERQDVPGIESFHYVWKYAPGVVMHEFGHTAGLTDLYYDTLTGYSDYLMGPSNNYNVSSIPSRDKAYIRQIYYNHSPH